MGRRAFGFGVRRAGFGPLGVGAPGFTLRHRLQGQLQLDVLPPGPHERCRPTDPCPSFGPSPASRLLCPLLTSAPRSRALRTRSVRDFRTRRRPPEVRPTALAASPPDLPSRPLMALDFAITRSLVRPGRPRIRFLFIGSRLCSTLPSDPASRRRPCASLILHRHQAG